MDSKIVKSRCERAIQRLLDHDSFLITNGADEQSVTFRLAMYLADEFPGLDVDCEYNRDETDPKRDTERKLIRPDIIVHRRGTQENILVIEAKKPNNPNDDEKKLQQLTSKEGKLKYRFGVRLVLKTGNCASITGDLYMGGELAEENWIQCRSKRSASS
ncbi:MAG: hypothetical protein HKL96_10485 [Phycisphaerales bacterium]|nr:hypothetical protein [Phycisphaerales bacterium]